MNTPMFVRPAGPPVKDPHGRLIAELGEWVTHDYFWAIRLLHGDVVEADPPADAEKPETQPAPVLDPAAVLPPRKRGPKGA